MILAYSHVIYLIANIFRVFSINLFLETIFSKDNLRCSQELKRTIFILYYLFNSIIYLHYRIPIITVFSNLCLFFFLTLPYYSTMCKRIFAVFCIFLLGILCETIVSRSSILIWGHIPSIEVITYTISNFLFYIVVILTKSILGQEERIYQKGRWAVLIMIPSISAFADIWALYGGYEQWITVSVIFCLFLINIAFFYLYQIVVSNYEVEIENQSLMLQNKAYQQQLDMIHATEDSLKRARHDFKNHLIALEELSKSEERTDLQAYFQKLCGEYQLSEDYICTGNTILDGLMNHKLKIMMATGATIDTKMQIPENIDINSFDLVVVIGNLLDNAIEALSKQEKGNFEIEISYRQGILLINAKNTFKGEIIKRGETLISTKKNATEAHGIGLSNVRRVIDKYDGEMMINTDNQFFSVHIVMYI